MLLLLCSDQTGPQPLEQSRLRSLLQAELADRRLWRDNFALGPAELRRLSVRVGCPERTLRARPDHKCKFKLRRTERMGLN